MHRPRFQYGNVASIFDLQARDSIAELLYDKEAVSLGSPRRRCAQIKGSRLLHRKMETVGASEPTMCTCSTAAQVYQFVLRIAVPTTRRATTLSADLVLLVTTRTSSVRDAFRRLKMLNTLGVEKDRFAWS